MFIVGRCKKGLHELTDWNLGRLKSGVVFCRACRHLYRARLYWSEQLDAYWRTKMYLLLPPTTKEPASPNYR